MDSNVLQQILSADNTVRKRAEEFLINERTSNPANLLNILLEGMKNDGNIGVAQLAAITYKKLFLDDAKSESLSETDLEMMKSAIMQTLDFS